MSTDFLYLLVPFIAPVIAGKITWKFYIQPYLTGRRARKVAIEASSQSVPAYFLDWPEWKPIWDFPTFRNEERPVIRPTSTNH